MKNTIRRKLQLISTAPEQETCVLVAVQSKNVKESQAREYLDELEFLAQTAGAVTGKRYIQKLDYPDPKYYVGKGKLEEIREYVQANEPSLVIFDDELSPAQVRNLEKVFNGEEAKVKVLDRSTLILDIFARHARTAQARLQVELAQSQYLLPRLTRLWTHLSKQKGGIGMKGPGEKEIETDRRIIRDKISLLKEKLEHIDRQSVIRRKNRGELIRVALVGYTNTGKSTLLNLLSKSEVLAENKLFATLDATVRKVSYGETSFLLTDTVGFIRKLPHQLVECFKSTLDEIREADLLLHVVDISHPGFEEQVKVVQETLQEIGVASKPAIMVFNKIDRYNPEEHSWFSEEEGIDIPVPLEQLKRTWMAKVNSPTVFISAAKKLNIEELRSKLLKTVVSLEQIVND